jgi:hypothetical protein
MSSLSTLPKGDSAWLLRKAIERVIQQISVLETNIGSSTTGNSANTQIIFNDNGTLRGDSGLTYNPATDLLSSVNQSLSGNLTVRTNKMAVTSTGTGFGTATPGAGFIADFLGDVRLTGAQTLIGNQSITGDSTINGSLTVTGAITSASANSAIRAAASDYAAVNFDGATANTRITSTLTGQNIGTGDFSVWARFRVPALAAFASNPGIIALGPNATDGGGNSSIRVVLLSGGTLSVRINDGAGVTTNADIANFATNFAGQVVDLIVTRTGSTLKVYINGTDTVYTGTPAANESINSVYCHVGIGGAGAAIFPGRIYRSVVFNRALSAADVVEVGTTGVNPADQWGTQTDIINASTLNGGFETAGGGGADVFANWNEVTSGSSTINRDTSIFYAGTASCRFDLDISGSSVAIQSATATFARNKRYRVSCFARSTATNGRLSLNVGSASFSAFGAVLNNLSWQEIVFEFVTEGGGTNTFTISRFTGASNGSIWIDNVTFTRIGAIVDLDFTVGTGYQATDRSTNSLHGTLFNGVSFTDTKKVAVVYATTATNGNQQMLGTLAIPTNAIIEDIIVNSTGSATVSIGNASAGTQIVNGASVVSGRQKLTLATPFSTTGNLWVNSNTADTLQFTILYTIAS